MNKDDLEKLIKSRKGLAYPSPAQRLASRWNVPQTKPGPLSFYRYTLKCFHKHIVCSQLESQVRPQQFIFLLGSMRSGSSLLSSIICSNKEVLGFGENHIQYQSLDDLRTLVVNNLRVRREWRLANYNFVFDKILHTELLPNPELYSALPIKWIFIHRNGKACVQSMIDSLGMKEVESVDYYRQRISYLIYVFNTLNESGVKDICITTYDLLTEQSERELLKINKYLGLARPLSKNYSLQRGSQVRGAADPSSRLLAGKIIKDNRKRPHLSDSNIQRLNEIDEEFNSLVLKF